MTVINLNTGKVKTTKKEPLPNCEICDTEVKEDGMSGNIGQLPLAFCGICKLGIVQMLIDSQNQGR